MTDKNEKRSLLITGAGGYIGRQLVAALAVNDAVGRLCACDIRLPPAAERLAGVDYEQLDVRDSALAELCRARGVDSLVHLAAVVTPGAGADRRLLYEVDVLGTRNVLQACRAAGVGQLVLTSSGAAYGYHADNPAWLDEHDALRGNPEFAYSDHKRQVEQMLADWRRHHPELAQLVFRPCTVLGAGTRNQITALFERPLVLGLRGSDTPFVLIWDQDVVAALERGVVQRASGIYNLAGDGVLCLRQMARMMNKPYVALPPAAVAGALWLLGRLRLTGYGPEQVDFLRYRPVLANARLKHEFGYTPQKTSAEVFAHYLAHRDGRHG